VLVERTVHGLAVEGLAANRTSVDIDGPIARASHGAGACKCARERQTPLSAQAVGRMDSDPAVVSSMRYRAVNDWFVTDAPWMRSMRSRATLPNRSAMQRRARIWHCGSSNLWPSMLSHIASTSLRCDSRLAMEGARLLYAHFLVRHRAAGPLRAAYRRVDRKSWPLCRPGPRQKLPTHGRRNRRGSIRSRTGSRHA
jgi:hypothetical protein